MTRKSKIPCHFILQLICYVYYKYAMCKINVKLCENDVKVNKNIVFFLDFKFIKWYYIFCRNLFSVFKISSEKGG